MTVVTVLRTVGRLPLAKTYSLSKGGLVVRHGWSNAKTFSVEQTPANNINELLHLLRRIEQDPTACVIRGEPIAGTDLTNTRRQGTKNGGNFDDVPRSWVMLDLDGVKLPASVDVLDDPQHVARILVDLVGSQIPELEGASAIVQFSSSAGLQELAEAEATVGLPPRWGGVIKSGVAAHVWFWLDAPVGEVELLRWAAAINKRAAHKFVDPATLRTVQPHYTAGPIFERDLRDPLPGQRTLLITGERDASTLDIPAVHQRCPYKPGESRHNGQGYSGWLAAIGGEAGFHQPINSAVAAFIAANWPDPDADTLKGDLVAHILAADPGGRSPSEIERYASDNGLDARISWTAGREQAKRETQAAADAAAAAQPIQPTYPDVGISLAAADRKAANVITNFAAQIAAGEMPQLLLKMTVGAGKTSAAISALPALLAAGRKAERGPVLAVHPRHKLGDQIATDIHKRHPTLKVTVWRGQDAADPAQPGCKMCQDQALPRAAKAAGQSATAGCPACPLAATCSYLLQGKAGRGADVWVAAHQVGFMMPFSGWPRTTVDGVNTPMRPTAVIVDEDITGTAAEGLNPMAPVQLALSALASDETPNVTGTNRQRLLAHRRRASAVLIDQPAGALFREPVEYLGDAPIPPPPASGGWRSMDEAALHVGTTSAAREWAALEWECKPKVKIAKGTTRAEALDAFNAAAQQGFTRLRPMLVDQIGAFLTSGDHRSVNLTLVPDAELGRGQGTGPAVRLAWRKDLHSAWTAPLLFLNATARVEVLRHWAPQLEVANIEVAAPDQYVVQVSDQECGRSWLQKPGNVGAMTDVIMVELAQADGSVLVVMQKGVEALIRPEINRRGGHS